MDGNTLTIAGVGATIIAAVAWLFRSWTKQVSANFAAQASLDERLPKIVDTITKPFEQIIRMQGEMLAEERTEKRRAQDERDSITRETLTFMRDTHKAYETKVEKVEENNRSAYNQLRGRLDECDNERKGQDAVIASLRADNASLSGRLDRLEDRERQTLREAPSPHQPPPAAPVIMPVVVPGQTVMGPAPP